MSKLSYTEFKNIFGDLGVTEWVKYNWLSNYNFGLPTQSLPSDYIELEYIQNSGGQYIDTEWKIDYSKDIEINIKAQPLSMPSNSNRAALLSNFASSTNFSLEFRDDCVFAWYYGNLITTVMGQSLDIKNCQFKYANNKATLKANEYTYQYEVALTDKEQTNNCLIFIDESRRWDVFTCYYKLYSMQIKEDNKLIRDFVPCIHNNQIGLYDRVTKKFFENKGTGSFTAGSRVQRYQRVEYVQFDNQYVDTGLKSTQLDVWKQEATVQFDNIDSGLNGADYGLYWGVYQNRFVNTITTTPLLPRCNADTNKHKFVSVITATKQYNDFYVDGSKYRSNRTSYDIDRKIMIGTIGRIDEPNTSYMAKEKVYSYKIYKNNELLRNYIPALDLETNKYVLYDLVEKKAYDLIKVI